MQNILLIIFESIICYIIIIILNKKYNTDGLYVYAIIGTIISSIMNLKQIELLNVSIPTGFGVSASLLIASNIITQKRGNEELKTYLILILLTSLICCIFFNLSGIMEASEYSLYANKSYNSIFKYNLRIYIGTIISLLTSIYLSGKLYYFIKKVKNKIFISNTLTVIIINLIESIIFTIIAFLFEISPLNLIICIVLRYMIKTLISLFGTIPIYITSK